MPVFPGKPGGGGEVSDLGPNLAFLTFESLGFGLVEGELFQIGLDQGGYGYVELGRSHPGTPIGVVVHPDCDIAHDLTVSQA